MGKPTGYTIVLVRTGPTDWDESGRLIGGTDLPMSTQGEQQFRDAIRASVDSAESPKISSILTSSEEAALKASAILNHGHDAKIRELDGLCNVGLGLWEGVLATELEERCKTAYREWADSPMRITPPEGETMTEAQDRLVSSLIKGLSKSKGDHPVVAVVLRPLAWALLRGWMMGSDTIDVWESLEAPITVETIELSSERIGSFSQRIRASA
ncbi:MAG: histidine phosphatase family protein [Phycisphaerales bacterium]|nr:histidine phosphatase family protein [Phycisphaerales bacterium]